MFKKISIAMAVAAAVMASSAPAALAGDPDYLINVKQWVTSSVHLHFEFHNTHHIHHQHPHTHYVQHISGSACDRGGATSAPGSIATLSTKDSCKPFHEYGPYNPS
jgi:hypothetical protein